MSDYESKAKIATIKAISRASIKIKDSFYTFEYGEERLIPDTDDVDIEAERALLWRDANTEVDNQIEETLRIFKTNG